MPAAVQALLAAPVAEKHTGKGPPDDIQYMPPGQHTIHATRDGEPVTVEVNVDHRTAQTLDNFLAKRLALAAEGLDDKPYFDLNHDDREAAAWPIRFYWAGSDPKTGGVRAKVEWTGAGRNAITDRTFRRFSPTFHVDDKTGTVTGSETNMGGLVNRAAFKRIAPLFARAPAPADSTSAARTMPNYDAPQRTAREIIHGPPPVPRGGMMILDRQGNVLSIRDADRNEIWRAPGIEPMRVRYFGPAPAPAPGHSTRFYPAGDPRSDWLRQRSAASRRKHVTRHTMPQRVEGSEPPSIDAINRAAAEADGDPTDAQKDAGNYRKGHILFRGLDVTIENPRGSIRSGTDPDGHEWSAILPAHYGYIRRTEGADGDHLDVFIGPVPDAETVFVIQQRDLASGEFDEHKAMIGFADFRSAVDTYASAFSDGKGHERVENVLQFDFEDFRQWLFSHTSKGNSPTAAGAVHDQGDDSYPDGAGLITAALDPGPDTSFDLPSPGEGYSTRLYHGDHARSNEMRRRSAATRARQAAARRARQSVVNVATAMRDDLRDIFTVLRNPSQVLRVAPGKGKLLSLLIAAEQRFQLLSDNPPANHLQDLSRERAETLLDNTLAIPGQILDVHDYSTTKLADGISAFLETAIAEWVADDALPALNRTRHAVGDVAIDHVDSFINGVFEGTAALILWSAEKLFLNELTEALGHESVWPMTHEERIAMFERIEAERREQERRAERAAQAPPPFEPFETILTEGVDALSPEDRDRFHSMLGDLLDANMLYNDPFISDVGRANNVAFELADSAIGAAGERYLEHLMDTGYSPAYTGDPIAAWIDSRSARVAAIESEWGRSFQEVREWVRSAESDIAAAADASGLSESDIAAAVLRFRNRIPRRNEFSAEYPETPSTSQLEAADRAIRALRDAEPPATDGKGAAAPAIDATAADALERATNHNAADLRDWADAYKANPSAFADLDDGLTPAERDILLMTIRRYFPLHGAAGQMPAHFFEHPPPFEPNLERKLHSDSSINLIIPSQPTD